MVLSHKVITSRALEGQPTPRTFSQGVFWVVSVTPHLIPTTGPWIQLEPYTHIRPQPNAAGCALLGGLVALRGLHATTHVERQKGPGALREESRSVQGSKGKAHVPPRDSEQWPRARLLAQAPGRRVIAVPAFPETQPVPGRRRPFGLPEPEWVSVFFLLPAWLSLLR